MKRLQFPFPSVQKGDVCSYGGNQGWSPKAHLRSSGCGVICCTDLLLYLHRHRPGFRTDFFRTDSGAGPVPLGRYNGWAERFSRRYLPVIPRFGSPGAAAALALNRYFRFYRLPLRARWGASSGQLWKRMEEMLQADLPVILTIGPNFPLPLNRHKLTLCRPLDHAPAGGVSAHFVTVTGMDQDWLSVSSWGREYHISRREWLEYAQKHSSLLVSNLVYLRPV